MFDKTETIVLKFYTHFRPEKLLEVSKRLELWQMRQNART